MAAQPQEPGTGTAEPKEGGPTATRDHPRQEGGTDPNSLPPRAPDLLEGPMHSIGLKPGDSSCHPLRKLHGRQPSRPGKRTGPYCLSRALSAPSWLGGASRLRGLLPPPCAPAAAAA